MREHNANIVWLRVDSVLRLSARAENGAQEMFYAIVKRERERDRDKENVNFSLWQKEMHKGDTKNGKI